MLFRALKKYCFIHDIEQIDISKWIGKSLSYVNNRLNAKGSFTIEEVYTILEKAGIPVDQITTYFPAGGKLTENQSLEIKSNIILLSKATLQG